MSLKLTQRLEQTQRTDGRTVGRTDGRTLTYLNNTFKNKIEKCNELKKTFSSSLILLRNSVKALELQRASPIKKFELNTKAFLRPC